MQRGRMAVKTTSDSEKELPMIRPRVEAAEKLIGATKYALNGQADVTLVDYMGDDSAIPQAARVSYGKGTRKVNEDRGLIRYLMRHRHTTPFEMVEFKFRFTMPLFVRNQWIRHRTANVNEYSLRYSIARDKFYVPEPSAVAPQSKTNKQGREGELPKEVVENFIKTLSSHSELSYKLYTEALEAGVTRELARCLLTLNFSTEFYWKIDLHNLFHFLGLRLDAHAQYEIRAVSQVMADIVKEVVPLCYEAFEDFVLNSVSLSNKEKKALQYILDGKSVEDACSTAKIPLKKADGTPIRTGEGHEFLEKLGKIKESVSPSELELRDAPE